MKIDLKQKNHPYFETQIIQGTQSIKLLENNEFKKGWNFLLQNSVLNSVFQDIPFVLSWYRTNMDNFNPIVLLGYSENKLVGLLTLAQKIDRRTGQKSNKLEGAGTFSALVQTWLVLPDFQDVFWAKGIKGLFKIFPGCQINLKYLPKFDGFEILQNNPNFKSIVILEKYQNPFLDYRVQDYKQILNKRHFRSKYNRLKRVGEVKLEKVESLERFNYVLEKIVTFHDLRQGAAFNIIPFGNDTELLKTFKAWFEKGILYASLLILNEHIIGAIFFINENEKIMHLAGLITYSPHHAKFSPGLVHLYLLGLQFQKEGFQSINLSPGYDSYKDRFSNHKEEIFEILISKNIFDIFRRKIRIKFRQILLKKGIRPMDIQVLISKKKSVYKNRFYHFLKFYAGWNQNSNESLLIWAKNQIAIANIDHISNSERNNLNDLLLIGEFNFNRCRWEFLEDALKRLDDDQNFISHVLNDKLVWCIWYKTSAINEGESVPIANIKEVFVSKSFNINTNKMEGLKSNLSKRI